MTEKKLEDVECAHLNLEYIIDEDKLNSKRLKAQVERNKLGDIVNVYCLF